MKKMLHFHAPIMHQNVYCPSKKDFCKSFLSVLFFQLFRPILWKCQMVKVNIIFVFLEQRIDFRHEFRVSLLGGRIQHFHCKHCSSQPSFCRIRNNESGRHRRKNSEIKPTIVSTDISEINAASQPADHFLVNSTSACPCDARSKRMISSEISS